MPTTSQPRTGAILTEDMIQGWRKEASDLESQIQKGQQRLVMLRRRLDAVAVIIGDMELPEPAMVESPDADSKSSGGDRSVIEAIPRILRMKAQALQPSKIREALRSEGFDDKQLGPYFYTALMRLTNRGAIIKSGKRYKASNPTESEAEVARASNGATSASNSIPADHRATQPLAKEANYRSS